MSASSICRRSCGRARRLVVEVHHRPSQPFWLPPVSAETVFQSAVPSAAGVPGILAPEPAAHAVLLLAHAWADGLLGSVGQLLDAAALLACSDRRRAEHFARAWDWEKMWTATVAVMDTVIGGKSPSLAVKVLARHLPDVRERLVLEDHISRLAAPAWTLPAGEVPRALASALRYTATPAPGEDWMTQLRRSCLAIAHAFRPGSEHEQTLLGLETASMPRRPAERRTAKARRGSICPRTALRRESRRA